MKLSDLDPATQARVKAQSASSESPISLVLPYPPTVNTYWRHVVIGRSARVLISKDGREFKARVQALASASRIAPLRGAVKITVDFYRPRRIGDLDNLTKGLLDALKGIAFIDDAQVEEIVLRRFDDKARPRSEVRIERIGGA